MRPELRRRLEQLENRPAPQTSTATKQRTGREELVDMLGCNRPPKVTTPQWIHYDALEIAYAANSHIERLTAALEDKTAEAKALEDETRPYPSWVQSPEDRRLYRKGLAGELSALRGVIDLLEGVRGDAAREVPRTAEPFPEPQRLPVLEDGSAMDLIALALMNLEHPPNREE